MVETVLAAIPEPSLNHKFKVVIVADGSAAAGGGGNTGAQIGCSKVDGLESNMEETQYREGDQPTTPGKYLTSVMYPDVTIEKGLTSQSNALVSWHEAAIAESEDSMRTVLIYVYGRGSTVVRVYKLAKAQAKGLKLGTLDANSPGVLIESLVLSHQGMTVSSNPSV